MRRIETRTTTRTTTLPTALLVTGLAVGLLAACGGSDAEDDDEPVLSSGASLVQVEREDGSRLEISGITAECVEGEDGRTRLRLTNGEEARSDDVGYVVFETALENVRGEEGRVFHLPYTRPADDDEAMLLLVDDAEGHDNEVSAAAEGSSGTVRAVAREGCEPGARVVLEIDARLAGEDEDGTPVEVDGAVDVSVGGAG